VPFNSKPKRTATVKNPLLDRKGKEIAAARKEEGPALCHDLCVSSGKAHELLKPRGAKKRRAPTDGGERGKGSDELGGRKGNADDASKKGPLHADNRAAVVLEKPRTDPSGYRFSGPEVEAHPYRPEGGGKFLENLSEALPEKPSSQDRERRAGGVRGNPARTTLAEN